MRLLMALAKIVGAAGLILSLLAMIVESNNILEFIVYGLGALTNATIIFLAHEAESTWLD